MKIVPPLLVVWTLFNGYVTKVRCEGRLLVSAIGNPELVYLEALPGELGCGVILKPLKPTGKTNLLLETSTGSHNVVFVLSNLEPSTKALEYQLRGDVK